MTSDNRRGRKSSGSSNKSGSRSRTSSRSSNSGKKYSTTKRNSSSKKNQNEELEFDYVKALIYIGVFAVLIIMFLFALGIFEGGFGMFLTNLVRGLFGFDAFVIPIVGIGLCIYILFRDITKKTVYNFISGGLFVISIGMLFHAISYKLISENAYLEAVKVFYHDGKGGGVIFGTFAYLIDKSCGKALVYVISIVLIVASIVVWFGKYIVRYAKILYTKYNDLDDGPDDSERQYTAREIRKMREKEAAASNKKSLSYKISDTEEDDTEVKKNKENIIDVSPSEIKPFFEKESKEDKQVKIEDKKESNDIHQVEYKKSKNNIDNDDIKPVNVYSDNYRKKEPVKEEVKETEIVQKPIAVPKLIPAPENNEIVVSKPSFSEDPALDAYKSKPAKPSKPYQFPPVSLLKKSDRRNGKGGDNIIETAEKLKETLQTFGVEVSIDPANCSKGPAVTRYELTPAPGVKVSRIVSLADDIKLSLGAADIRIEAPIPGKSAVGIEVPNSESSAVPFRDLIESKDFTESKSKISFAVGKDLAGDVVIADIAKMPHLLIAGATGSGKSVCINTIIMSILYKAHYDDVKLILIDPKVVELSVYNGIPHLLLPVVTDPKQASTSLHWGVSEMEDRYKKFADLGVRDLKGYNEKVSEDPNAKKLPQIVIIVDELADLMMVAGKEVEESICRLAQLARAAGIHLIIATQRPSVDVITGLIKANMPSRIAFSVSSGIDSRTILDSNGAEKLLGKGDMLFFPQGMNKPSRVQGCFVSDEEVSNVVDFIKNQNIDGYDQRMIETVKNPSSATLSAQEELDELFVQAGLFIIGKEKASIGALQRAFKIGFNRAARIMDQLEAKGVVGPEEGTKPRKIIMDESEFTNMTQDL